MVAQVGNHLSNAAGSPKCSSGNSQPTDPSNPERWPTELLNRPTQQTRGGYPISSFLSQAYSMTDPTRETFFRAKPRYEYIAYNTRRCVCCLYIRTHNTHQIYMYMRIKQCIKQYICKLDKSERQLCRTPGLRHRGHYVLQGLALRLAGIAGSVGWFPIYPRSFAGSNPNRSEPPIRVA